MNSVCNELPVNIEKEVSSVEIQKHSKLERNIGIAEQIRLRKKDKKHICKFCDGEIDSKHFARHLKRNHFNECQVKEIFSTEVKSIDRRRLLSLLRNEGNLDYSIRGQVIPKRRDFTEITYVNNDGNYVICPHCKAYFKRLCLSRHVKKCFAKPETDADVRVSRPLNSSLIYTACQKKFGDILNKLAAKKEIFGNMQADTITSKAMEDPLILFFGEDLLKKVKGNRSTYHISNKIRECARFIIEMQKLGPYTDVLSTLKAESFDDAIEAIKNMSKFNSIEKSFGAPSLALHFGSTLKKLSDLAEKLILRKKIPLLVENKEETLSNLKRFYKVVDSQWSVEVGSLALKDLNEKVVSKPKLLPLTEDIMKLKNFVHNAAETSYKQLKTLKSMTDFKILVETTLVLTIIHNRKRVGDIQYLDLNSYNQQINSKDNSIPQTELANSLSDNEKILTHHYKRIVSIGKGSRPVAILIPKDLQLFF